MNICCKNLSTRPLHLQLLFEFIENPALTIEDEQSMLYAVFLSSESVYKRKWRGNELKQISKIAAQFKKSLPVELRSRVIDKKRITIFDEKVAVEMWLKHYQKGGLN